VSWNDRSKDRARAGAIDIHPFAESEALLGGRENHEERFLETIGVPLLTCASPAGTSIR
jgi:hypothetical protein